MSAIDPVHAAWFTALDADAPLGALVTGVFDHIPEDEAFPYLVIGEFTEARAGTHDKAGWIVTGKLDAWDTQEGFDRLQRVLTAVDGVLERKRLTTTGFDTGVIERTIGETLRETDPDTKEVLRHLVARYRVQVLAQ